MTSNFTVSCKECSFHLFQSSGSKAVLFRIACLVLVLGGLIFVEGQFPLKTRDHMMFSLLRFCRCYGLDLREARVLKTWSSVWLRLEVGFLGK